MPKGGARETAVLVQARDAVTAEPRQSQPVDRGAMLRVEGLRKAFGAVEVLHGIDMELLSGEVHALLGENGAGKSTIINIASGRLAPDAGRIEMRGKEVRFASPLAAKRAGVSIIAQELELVPTLSIIENIFLGVEPTSFGLIRWRDANAKVATVLRELGVSAAPTQLTGSLAVADQQLVEIAKAIIGDFRLLIMDEPTSALSLEETQRLFRIVRRLKSEGVAILYVSHRIWEIFDVADRVTVLRDGYVVQRSRIAETDSQAVIKSMLGAKSSLISGRPPGSRSGRNAGKPVLQVQGLTSLPNLRDIDLTVAAGEVVGLAGVLGSGRTELCEAIYGLRRVAPGTKIELNGRPAKLDEPKKALREGVFLLPEDRKQEGIFPHLGLRENVILAKAKGAADPDRPRQSLLRRFLLATGLGLVRAGEEIEIFERYRSALDIKCSGAHSRITELSGGNQQKVLFARGGYVNPALMVLSDPTRGVDIGAKEEIYTAIDNLAARGTGIIVSSSEITELLRLCERIYVLRHGQIVAEVASAESNEEAILQIMAA
jgi:ABC-type sugar transport system ATPase subunit